MSFPATCSACQASFDLPDHLKGKEVSCSKCRQRFVAGATAAATPAEAPPAPPVADNTPAIQSRPADVVPVGASMPTKGERFSREDEDAKRQSDGFPLWLILVGVGIVGLLFLGGVGLVFLVGFMFSARSTNQAQAYREEEAAMQADAVARERDDIRLAEPMGAAPEFQARTVLNQVDGGDLILPCVCWTGPETFVYLDRNGKLCRNKFQVGVFNPESKSFDKTAIWLDRSSAGLVLTFMDDSSLHLVDGDTLKSLKEIALPWQPGRVASSPALSLAIVVAADGRRLAVVDLQTDKVKTYTDDDFLPTFGLLTPTVSPDGKFLFTLGSKLEGHRKVHRFRINGLSLKLEEIGDRTISTQDRLEISSDNQWLAVHRIKEIGENVPRVPTATEGVALYPASDLKSLDVVWLELSHPTVIGIDSTRKFVYVGTDQNANLYGYRDGKQLAVRMQPLTGHGALIRQLTVQPETHKILALTDQELVLLELAPQWADPQDQRQGARPAPRP